MPNRMFIRKPRTNIKSMNYQRNLLLKRLSNHRMQVLEIEDDQQSYGSIRTTWKTTKMRDFVTFFESGSHTWRLFPSNYNILCLQIPTIILSLIFP